MKTRNTRLFVILLVFIPIFLPVTLSLYRDRVEAKSASSSTRYEIKDLESRILSAERGSKVFHHYSVVFPQLKRIEKRDRVPLIIHIPAFGEDHRLTKGILKRTIQLLDLREDLTAIHIFLDPLGPHNHHYFVDSPKNGSVGIALVQELLPELKRVFPINRIFLTGHSSGAWSALWLQLEYPDLFSGVWATSPDPIDFRNFYGVDLTSEKAENLFVSNDGTQRKAIRGRSIPLKKFIESEEESAPLTNEWISMEAAFSPIAPSGESRKLFNRLTGEIDTQVATAWGRYNLAKKILELPSEKLLSLKGKINIFCGAKDEYYLDQPFELFCKELKRININGHCELVEGKGHNSIYEPSPSAPDGLVIRIWKEISEQI